MTIAPPLPVPLEQADAALHERIIRTLDRADQDPLACPIEIVVNEPPKARPVKKPKVAEYATIEELWMLDPEPLARHGECPGGVYWYLDDPDLAAALLNGWADQEAWAAFDFETSAGWRWTTDPETGEKKKSYWNRSGSTPKVYGSDPWTSTVFLMSVSVSPGEAIVFDSRILDQVPVYREAIRRFLTRCKLVVHGAIFENSFAKVKYLSEPGDRPDLYPNIVYDTLVGDQVANAGRFKEHGLDACLFREYGIKLVKSWQSQFLKVHRTSPLPNSAMVYSAGDVCRHLDLARSIHRQLVASGQEHLWRETERPFMRELARAKVEGFPINQELIEQLLGEVAGAEAEAREKLQALLPEGLLISSSAQLLVHLQEHGPKDLRWSAEAKKKIPVPRIKSTAEDMLRKVITWDPEAHVAQVAKGILEWRKLDLMKKRYLQAMLDHFINPATGRLHPDWKQCEAVTGRMACENPPLQQVPSKGKWAGIRLAFQAPAGCKVVTCDLSQFEVRVLAEMSRELKMIQVFLDAVEVRAKMVAYCGAHGISNLKLDELRKDAGDDLEKGKTESARVKEWQAIERDHPDVLPIVEELINLDFHTRTAATIYKIPVTEVKKSQRGNAKTTTFAIPYGGDEHTIAKNSGMALADAKELLDAYFGEFTLVKQFLDLVMAQALAKGYTETPYGRKRFYVLEPYDQLFARFFAMASDPEQQAKWDKLCADWYCRRPHEKTPEFLASKIHEADKRSIERQATNHPIQGANADVTKLASVLMGPRLRALDPRCYIAMWIHDEVVAIAPEGLEEAAAEIVQASMIEAANRFLKTVPTEVSCAIAGTWVK